MTGDAMRTTLLTPPLFALLVSLGACASSVSPDLFGDARARDTVDPTVDVSTAGCALPWGGICPFNETCDMNPCGTGGATRQSCRCSADGTSVCTTFTCGGQPTDAGGPTDAGQSCLAEGFDCHANSDCCSNACVDGLCSTTGGLVFACGTIACVGQAEYCLHIISDTGGPDQYSCPQVLAGCPGVPDCACLRSEMQCGGACTVIAPGDLMISCGGG
jgi:hypothetical protein